jgi:ribosomal protein S18 acetylase RimI-like enzyme
MTPHIRKATPHDFEAIWPIFHAVVSAGTTYPYAKTTTKDQGRHLWMEVPLATYLAEENGKTLGTYYIKPNQPDLGAHICNCGYMVAPDAQGQGLGTALCLHSQQTARENGFTAMQFNLVVSTNTPAIHLWRKLGFSRIGTIPLAFNHSRYGLVDALIMYKQLTPVH